MSRDVRTSLYKERVLFYIKAKNIERRLDDLLYYHGMPKDTPVYILHRTDADREI